MVPHMTIDRVFRDRNNSNTGLVTIDGAEGSTLGGYTLIADPAG